MDPLDLMTRFAPTTPHGVPERLGYKLLVEPIRHRRFQNAMFQIAELHHRRRKYGQGGGLLMTGPSGAGKSTIIRTYDGEFPRSYEAQRTAIPVLLASVPSSPTVRSLAGAMLEAMGDRKSHRGTAPEKTTKLRELFERCGVEMLLLDEFQHLFYTPNVTAFRDVTDWLKNLLEDTHIGLVGCGLHVAEQVVTSNEQLARRFSQRLRIEPFSQDVEDDFREYRGILKALEACLPTPSEVPLHEANLARRMHVASYGLLDYTLKILEGAVSAANRAGIQSIALDVLSAGFRERVWRDVPDRLNPFHPESPLRPLDRPGEVFFQHTRLDTTGSPVAAKLGLRPKGVA
ncbi:TniB family NTP-binding protein [Jeongeupia naejangsanensis]|uniref:TniB family NTP-binding protein n=1 Tax=Jeongeupia naejangsanensis TaxID=613195 RepID=A0ABS2BLC9_9NEIS|nr:TniB family NTP-binding protein [Jeongeupia naejangsanensis]MBM3116411.1 TniB family NTP-binding protein [Jeongeupia naejangsanensis]